MAQLSCRIGTSIGQAIFVSDTQMKCMIEDIGLVPEGETAPAQISLNGYSWTETNNDPATGMTFYTPYSINAMFPASGPAHGGT